ncbi:MAG TPA: rod shape-determining protein MreC [Thermoanaerobaculia bacterium]|jgi:rod shape-determining protein MreC
MRLQSPLGEIEAVNPRRGGIVLAMVLIGCVLILSAQAPGRGGRGTVLQSWILTASSPAVNLVASASRSFWGAIGSTGELFRARTENERLRSDLDASQRELFRLRAEVKQLAAEGRLAAGSALPGIVRSVPILLVEHRSGVLSALIAAGSADGVVPDSPLAVPGGLVGRVVTVGRGVSRAQLLLDASAAAGARIARTGELGVIRGDGKDRLTLNNIATTSTVAPGDWIESAGIDGIYPRGIPIGRVESVSRGSKLFLEVRVAPSADFTRLTDLLLLSPSPATQENPEVGRSATR